MGKTPERLCERALRRTAHVPALAESGSVIAAGLVFLAGSAAETGYVTERFAQAFTKTKERG